MISLPVSPIIDIAFYIIPSRCLSVPDMPTIGGRLHYRSCASCWRYNVYADATMRSSRAGGSCEAKSTVRFVVRALGANAKQQSKLSVWRCSPATKTMNAKTKTTNNDDVTSCHIGTSNEALTISICCWINTAGRNELVTSSSRPITIVERVLQHAGGVVSYGDGVDVVGSGAGAGTNAATARQEVSSLASVRKLTLRTEPHQRSRRRTASIA